MLRSQVVRPAGREGSGMSNAPPYTCRFCGAEYEPEEEKQKYCSELCEKRSIQIDEAEARREESRDAVG